MLVIYVNKMKWPDAILGTLRIGGLVWHSIRKVIPVERLQLKLTDLYYFSLRATTLRSQKAVSKFSFREEFNPFLIFFFLSMNTKKLE